MEELKFFTHTLEWRGLISLGQISDYSSMIFAIFLMRGMMEGVELMVARFLGFMPIIGEREFIPKYFHEYTTPVVEPCKVIVLEVGQMRSHVRQVTLLVGGEASIRRMVFMGGHIYHWHVEKRRCWTNEHGLDERHCGSLAFERPLENHSPSYNFKKQNFKFCIEIVFWKYNFRANTLFIKLKLCFGNIISKQKFEISIIKIMFWFSRRSYSPKYFYR